MPNNIILKKSSVGDKVPLASDLEHGELALNFTDGNLFYKNNSNVVTAIASNKFVSVTGNVTGNYFFGDGSLLTGIQPGFLSATVDNFVGDGSTVSFTLSISPFNEALTSVNISGVSQLKTAYSIADSELTFTSAPAVGAAIEVTVFNSNATQANLENGNTSVTAPVENGNVVMTVGGVANIFVVSNSGANTTGTLSATGNITGNYFIGNGSQLTGLPEGYGNADVTAFLPTYTGNLASLTGAVITTANITGNQFIGSGAGLTAIPAANVTGTLSVNTTGSAATVTTAAQPNITSVGTLTSLSVTGNVTGGNFVGTISTAAQPNITSTGTLTLVSTSGNLSFSSTGQRILGDFSNATLSSRLLFQSSSGTFTDIGAIGPGAGNSSAWTAYYGNNPTNTSRIRILALADAGYLQSSNTGSGSYVPLILQTGGSNRVNIDVNGNVGIANGTPTHTLSVTGTFNVSGNANVGNIGATSVSVTGNVTGGNVTTAGLTNTGTLQTSGNAIIGGDLMVNGNTVNVNITNLNVQDPIIGLGRGANNAPLTTNDSKDRGTEMWYYDTAERAAFVGFDNSTGKMIAASNVSIANEIVTVNSYGSFVTGAVEAATVSATGNVTGATGAFVTVTGNANATSLTSGTVPSARLSGSYTINISGAATSATTAGTVTTAAQPNITSVGTLTSVSVTGNVTGGNLVTAGAVTGNGRALTSLNATNINTGTLAQARLANSTLTLGSTTLTLGATTTTVAGLSSVTSTTFVGALTGAATTAGTVTTAAQPNITSVGALTALTVTGDATVSGILYPTTQIRKGVNTFVREYASGYSSTHTPTDPQEIGRLTFTGNSENITIVGEIRAAIGATAGVNRFILNLRSNTLPSKSFTLYEGETTDFGRLVSVRVFQDTASGLVVIGYSCPESIQNIGWSLTIQERGNYNYFQQVNSLTSLDTAGLTEVAVTSTTRTSSGNFAVTGNVTAGNLVTPGLVSLSSIAKTGTTGVGNIGASGSTFDTVFAKATSAQYADLAEMYASDTDYPAGTVVVFGGSQEITVSTEYAQTSVAGVISTAPAYLMNSAAGGQPVALQGRVPCRAVGHIRKGDLLTSSAMPGVATRLDPADWRPGAVIGKALADYNSNVEGVIEAVVGRV